MLPELLSNLIDSTLPSSTAVMKSEYGIFSPEGRRSSDGTINTITTRPTRAQIAHLGKLDSERCGPPGLRPCPLGGGAPFWSMGQCYDCKRWFAGAPRRCPPRGPGHPRAGLTSPGARLAGPLRGAAGGKIGRASCREV